MANTPNIRFKGFTDTWEQRKVKELCSISTGKSNTQDKVEDGEYPFYVRSSIIEKSTKYLYDEEAVLTVGDGVGTGKVFHYVNGKYDLHQRCYRMYDFSKELNAKYFYQVFSKMFYKRVMAMTAKTSVDSVRLEMIADMGIPIPEIEEQQQIGDYFRNLDHLITLHQRKCDETKELKKYMLQKMFPKNGEKIPEIRFAGFTDDWEQRRLGEVAELNPKSELPDEFEYVDLEAVVGTEMISHRTENKASAPSRAQRLAQIGDVFFQTVRPYQRNNFLFLKSDNNYVFSTGYAQLRPYIDAEFLFVFLQTENFVKNVLDNCTGTSYPAINSTDLSNLMIVLPLSKNEQKKIGQYFSTFNRLIILHQRKCDELKDVKKFMMQNMFV